MNSPAGDFSIKEKKLKEANKKLIYIALLNILDGTLTYIGISNNLVVELNKLMINVISNFYRLIFIKLLIPTLLIFLTALLINRYDYSKMYIAKLFINIGFLVYIFILFTHIVWISMFAYTVFR